MEYGAIPAWRWGDWVIAAVLVAVVVGAARLTRDRVWTR